MLSCVLLPYITADKKKHPQDHLLRDIFHKKCIFKKPKKKMDSYQVEWDFQFFLK